MIPDEYVPTFEAVALQDFDHACERCIASLRWLEREGYIRCSSNRARTRAKRGLGRPVTLTPKGQALALSMGLDFVTLIAEAEVA